MTLTEPSPPSAGDTSVRLRLAETALSAVIIGLLVAGAILAGVDRIDTNGKERWDRGNITRESTLKAAEQARDGVSQLRADLGVHICPR